MSETGAPVTYYSDLQAQVALNESVQESAQILIEGVAAKLEAVQSDPAQAAVAIAQLRECGPNLAAAILENTPSAPPAPTA